MSKLKGKKRLTILPLQIVLFNLTYGYESIRLTGSMLVTGALFTLIKIGRSDFAISGGS